MHADWLPPSACIHNRTYQTVEDRKMSKTTARSDCPCSVTSLGAWSLPAPLGHARALPGPCYKSVTSVNESPHESVTSPAFLLVCPDFDHRGIGQCVPITIIYAMLHVMLPPRRGVCCFFCANDGDTGVCDGWLNAVLTVGICCKARSGSV